MCLRIFALHCTAAAAAVVTRFIDCCWSWRTVCDQSHVVVDESTTLTTTNNTCTNRQTIIYVVVGYVVILRDTRAQFFTQHTPAQQQQQQQLAAMNWVLAQEDEQKDQQGPSWASFIARRPAVDDWRMLNDKWFYSYSFARRLLNDAAPPPSVSPSWRGFLISFKGQMLKVAHV